MDSKYEMIVHTFMEADANAKAVEEEHFMPLL
jgi:hypothetical protein